MQTLGKVLVALGHWLIHSTRQAKAQARANRAVLARQAQLH